MTSHLELAGHILATRFSRPTMLTPAVLHANLSEDVDHQALANAIGLIIQHLNRDSPNAEDHLDDRDHFH